jgi:hypothetical protein
VSENREADKVIYPMMTWSVALGDDAKVCLVEVVFALNFKEAEAGSKGGESLSVPLAMTAKQCRELATDLIDAANRLGGKKGMT